MVLLVLRSRRRPSFICQANTSKKNSNLGISLYSKLTYQLMLFDRETLPKRRRQAFFGHALFFPFSSLVCCHGCRGKSAEYHPADGRWPWLGGDGLLRPSASQDAGDGWDGADGASAGSFLCGASVVFAYARERAHRSASQSLRHVCAGLFATAAGDHHRASARQGRVSLRAFWEMACRSGKEKFTHQPARDGVSWICVAR